jgi:hypothetical protein
MQPMLSQRKASEQRLEQWANRDAFALIQNMPEAASTPDILDDLYLIEQVERGLRDVVADRVISHEELKERLAQWRISAGCSAINGGRVWQH